MLNTILYFIFTVLTSFSFEDCFENNFIFSVNLKDFEKSRTLRISKNIDEILGKNWQLMFIS
jgi:hypothetical protein